MIQDRRRLVLARALRLALAGVAAAASPARAAPAARVASDPFTLGVASGCPEPDGVVIWTRLAPRPLEEGGGMDPVAVPVRWEVAEDEHFARVARSGTVDAQPGNAHAVHVEVGGLRPGRWYWYRFRAGDASSPAGRTRTAPAPGAGAQPMRFAIASCQHWEQGRFGAYRRMAEENVDLVAFLGDYIYETNLKSGQVRVHCNDEPKTLDAYRIRYGQYKSDPDLRRMHAAAPWLLTWDDHEVVNDYAGAGAQFEAPEFLARRAAAYRAYFEHAPLRLSATPGDAGARVYGRWGWGDLAEFVVLDARQYRSLQACRDTGRTRFSPAECPAIVDPARSMLGAEQERWLARTLRASRARWNVVAQQTLLSRFDQLPGPGERYWTEGWSGYQAAADRLVREIAESGARNPIVVSGDVHSSYVCDVKADFADPASKTVATEICGTSITSRAGLPQRAVDAVMPDNPHVLFADVRSRGYAVIELDDARAIARLRAIDDVASADPAVSTLGSFVVDAGRPGARRVA